MAKKGENFLDYIPAVSPRHTWSAEEGKVTIHMEHRGLYPWIAQKFFKRPHISHIALDEMGSFIYPLIDGQRTVEDLAQLVHQEFGEKADPLYDVFDDTTLCNNSYNISFNDAFSCGRVFGLLTYSNLVACCNKLCDITLS